MMVNARFVARLRVPLSFAVRILLVACLLLSVTASTIAAAPPPTNAGAAQGPLEPAARYLVVENVGQFAAEARFLVKQGDQRIWLTDDALWLTVPDPVAAGAQTESAAAGARSGTALRFTFQGANPGATLEPFDRVPTHVSYLIGNDPSRWQRDVPVWSGVRYRNLYPGVDLVIGGDAAGAVPWRLEAGPGANLQAVTLRVEGAETVAAEAGQLRLGMKGRAVDVALPAWSVAGQANPVGSTVVQQGGDGAFTVAPGAEPEPGQAPAAGTAGVADVTDLIYSTYLGGTAGDSGSAIAVDYLGNAYVTGGTESDTFPVRIGSYDLTYGGATDAFVAKFNATGTALLYATYLGGADLDVGAGIAVSGDLAYVVGETKSTDFPGMTGTVVGSDIFVVALNAAGSDVRYVARLGGGDFDTGYGIAVAGTEAYVVGNTFSTEIPNATGCTIANSSAGDLVVAKLNTLGVPVYTTCLGGSGFDAGYAIAVLNGEAYVTGQSWSTDFPDGLLTGPNDILVARFDANGVRDASALIGGPDEDLGWSIAVDGSDHVYIAGTTTIASAPPPAALVGGCVGRWFERRGGPEVGIYAHNRLRHLPGGLWRRFRVRDCG